MKPGLYEMVESKDKPHVVKALEGRRLHVRRNKKDDGWLVGITRTKKPIPGVRAIGRECDDISVNVHSKRTVSMYFHLTDEGAKGLYDALGAALALKETADKAKREGMPS